MRYRIVNALSLFELEKSVNKLMEIGFIPIGSFKVRGTTYYQTMYKQFEEKL